MSDPNPLGPGQPLTQKRSRKTYEALIAAGFGLLRDHEFESISIADIARASGYSVGAFYARFASKDEYFEALVARHLAERAESRKRLFDSALPDALIETVIEDMVGYYWRRRRFWRAVLMRSTNDSEFWRPVRESGRDFIELVTARCEANAQRPLTAKERDQIAFAVHMVYGVLNYRIINRPVPSLIGNGSFVPDLVRAFCLVSGYDTIGPAPRPGVN
jgi:AcrR family transcriptional regulator